LNATIVDFWKLLAQSKLLSSQQVKELATEFARQDQASSATPKAAAQWLLKKQLLTRYQAVTLLAGRPGPFLLGEYKILDRIDLGRLIGLLRAIHVPTRHPVLLQPCTGAAAKDEAAWSAAASAALAATRIISPYVHRLFEPLEAGGQRFLVWEDVHGKTLEEQLTSGRPPPAVACRAAWQAALGLANMHQQGRVHGDLRPANCYWDGEGTTPGQLKLLYEPQRLPGPIDWSHPTDAHLLLMADYLAPELAIPGRSPDALSDIYALGCTLYTLLSGAPPFAGGDVTQKMTRHASEPIQPLTRFGVPQPVADVVAFLMAKNPDVRIPSAVMAAERLAPFVEDGTQSASRPPAGAASLPAFEANVRQRLIRLEAALSSRTRASEPAPAPTPGESVKASDSPVAPAAVLEPVVAIGPPTAGARRSIDEIMRRRARKQRMNLIAVSLATLLIVVGTGFAIHHWWPHLQAALRGEVYAPEVAANDPATAPPADAAGNGGPPAGDGTAADGTASAGPPAGVTPASASGSGQQVVPDDGQLLWASPTAGAPIEFRCVPPEAQVFLVVRPAELLAHDEGRKALAALGPSFAEAQKAWEAASGVALAEVEQLILTLHNNDGQFPRAHYVVRTTNKLTLEQLLAKWGNPAAAAEQGEKYYTTANRAFYVSSAPEDERTFAMGDARDVKEVAALKGAPPPLFREIERLRRTTDAARNFTLLFYPPFLFNDDGEPLFGAERAKLREPLAWLLGDHLQAAAVSLHCGEPFYFEMRMLGSLDKEPFELAQELRGKLNEVPKQIENYLDRIMPPQYWSRLARRYPLMIGELHKEMRVGVENEQAIVNSVLPAPAAHNLLLGGELLLASVPGPAAAVSAAPASAAPSGPKTIEEALALRTTYSFDQQSLEFAMRDLADDVKSNLKGSPLTFEIKILGDDLKLDGITRNQSIRDFKQENQTVADILTALVRKANPITTVKDPSEADQKLIWVIGPDPENPAREIVLITTRAAAAARKYKLPAPFVAKAN